MEWFIWHVINWNTTIFFYIKLYISNANAVYLILSGVFFLFLLSLFCYRIIVKSLDLNGMCLFAGETEKTVSIIVHHFILLRAIIRNCCFFFLCNKANDKDNNVNGCHRVELTFAIMWHTNRLPMNLFQTKKKEIYRYRDKRGTSKRLNEWMRQRDYNICVDYTHPITNSCGMWPCKCYLYTKRNERTGKKKKITHFCS